jgi:hypothetical protein
MRGVTGTRIKPRVGRSRSKLTRSKSVTSAATSRTVTGDLQPQDRGRHTIAQRGNANRPRVDHLVEGVDVEPRRAGGGRRIERLAGERPQLPLQLLAISGCLVADELLGTERESRMLVSV